MSWRSATCSANVNRGLQVYKFNASTRQALWWEQPAALHRDILIYSLPIVKQNIKEKIRFLGEKKNPVFLPGLRAAVAYGTAVSFARSQTRKPTRRRPPSPTKICAMPWKTSRYHEAKKLILGNSRAAR